MNKLLIMSVVILSMTFVAAGKEWNGIKPLISTHAEVKKLLGDSKFNDWALGEGFEVDDQVIYIRWVRADCRGEEETKAVVPTDGANFVVSQITVEPRTPLTMEEVEKLDTPAKSVNGLFTMGPMNCIGGSGKWSCSTINPESGFGYSTEPDKQVVRLYYTATEKEYKAWSEKLLPCVNEIIKSQN